MARPKQQHYVTKAYLEGFLLPSARNLVCYGRNRGPFRRSPEDLACQRNYYALKKEDGTWDDSIEKIIGTEVEAPGLPVIQRLAAGKTKLDWQDRERLSLLIAFQEMRTPSTRERARGFAKVLNERVIHDIKASNATQESVEIVGRSGPKTVTLDEMVRTYEEYCDDHSMEIHRSLMGAAVKLAEFLQYMKFTVHYAVGEAEFVTTDTPVVRVFYDSAPLGAGVNRTDVEIRFPLSRKAFLTLTHDLKFVAELERASGTRRSRLLERLPEVRVSHIRGPEVTAFNRAHVRHAHLWAFAPNDQEWIADVLSQVRAAPEISDLSSRDLLHFQSKVTYDPNTDSIVR
jgi:hypothetical protein